MFKLNAEYLMSFLCWAFQFIMQLFDMKPFLLKYSHFISIWHSCQIQRLKQGLFLDSKLYYTDNYKLHLPESLYRWMEGH